MAAEACDKNIRCKSKVFHDLRDLEKVLQFPQIRTQVTQTQFFNEAVAFLRSGEVYKKLSMK